MPQLIFKLSWWAFVYIIWNAKNACIRASNAVPVDLLVSRVKRSVQGRLVHFPLVARQIALGRQKGFV